MTINSSTQGVPETSEASVTLTVCRVACPLLVILKVYLRKSPVKVTERVHKRVRDTNYMVFHHDQTY